MLLIYEGILTVTQLYHKFALTTNLFRSLLYTLIANFVAVNARNIGLNEYPFDALQKCKEIFPS